MERSENSSTRDGEMKKLGPGFKGVSAGALKLVGCPMQDWLTRAYFAVGCIKAALEQQVLSSSIFCTSYSDT